MKKEYTLQIKYIKGSDKFTIKSGAAGPWIDLGIMLEAIGMMIAQVERTRDNPHGFKTTEEIIDYCKNYLNKSGNDYKENWSASIPRL